MSDGRLTFESKRPTHGVPAVGFVRNGTMLALLFGLFMWHQIGVYSEDQDTGQPDSAVIATEQTLSENSPDTPSAPDEDTRPDFGPPLPEQQPDSAATATEETLSEHSPDTQSAPDEDARPFYGPLLPEEQPGPLMRGFLSARYRRRSSGGQHDDDLHTYLSLDVGNPDTDGMTFHLDGRLSRTLSVDKDTFGDLDDSRDGNTRALLYNAFIDFHDTGLDLLRVGRQTDYDTPEVLYYDGIHVRSEALDDRDTQVGTYGGISNHLYESSTDGDRLYGVYLETRPWEDGRIRLDWLHAEDQRTLGSSKDDLLAVQAWKTFDQLRLEGSFSRLEGDNRDFRTAATWFDPEHELLVRGSYYRLLETQGTRAVELDNFSSALFDLFPYEQIDISASQAIGQGVTLQGGASLRIVEDQGDKTNFNRDVNRYYLTTSFENVCGEANTLSVTGEHWQGDRNEHQALGVDLTRQISDELQCSVGSYYSLYKVDFSAQSEREDVQTYYMRFDYDISKAYSLDFGYEFENSSVGDFHNIRMAARWRF